MADDFNIRHFFRRSPSMWLRRYFKLKGVLANVDWLSIRPRSLEPLMVAWLALEEDMRGDMVEDFRAINLLATPAGKVQIIDEAVFHRKQEEVAAKLAELKDFYECAFWTFLEQPACWKGAVSFADADGKPRPQWRKRINMPRLGRSSTAADGRALGAALVTVFREKEGRGDHCAVEQFRRGEREYYFAYPQDHRQTAIEYSKGALTKRPHRPAFEIIFIHDDSQQTVSIWHRGRKERIIDLQLAFARAILGQDIPRQSPRDDRVYDLDVFLDPDFVFRPRPEFGIANAEVREMRVRVLGGEQHSITVALGAETPGRILQQRLGAATYGIPQSMLKVVRVGVRVTFEPILNEAKPKSRKFEIGYPNMCNVQDDSRGNCIQRMLSDHGIEPMRKIEEQADGSHAG